MKRILVLAYYYPPLGGVGPQRTVKLLKHLPALGYEPVVVTGPEGAVVDVAPADAALAAEIPAAVRVERIRTLPPEEGVLRSRARRLFGCWSALEQWWLREGTPIARTLAGEVDVVYASMSPFSTAGIASRAAGEAGVPWIADLQDPWALDEWLIYPTALHRRVEQRRMRTMLRGAGAIVMNTHEAARALLTRFPELASSRVVTIPQGWDREDFGGSPEPRPDSRFRIVYAGYSHVQRGLEHRARRRKRELLRGAVPGLDILTRSHVFLVEAIRRLADEDATLARRVEVHVAGAAPIVLEDSSRGVPIFQHGYLPHDRAVALMRSADLLFLAMHDLPPGMRTTTVPGKTYEYLAAGRPILAALPEGDARDLLAPLPSAWVCPPADVECMARAVREAIAASYVDTDAVAAVRAQFEWGSLAGELARLVDEVVARGHS